LKGHTEYGDISFKTKKDNRHTIKAEAKELFSFDTIVIRKKKKNNGTYR
jgi:hypothetical protein